MSENETKTASGAVKQAKAVPAKASGKIVYNPFLDNWRCIDASGNTVLSTGKEAAIAAYPDFEVIEKG